jgi:hypothetical protein
MGLKEIGFQDVVGFICLHVSPKNMVMNLSVPREFEIMSRCVTITVSRTLLNRISSRLLAFVYYFL